MRKSEAIYGGEISAHHYFRDFVLRQWNDTMVIDLATSVRKESTIEAINCKKEKLISIKW